MLSPFRRPVPNGPHFTLDFTLALPARVAAAASRWGHAYTTWRGRRQAIRELSALDDRALKDFGINRSEIEALAYGRRSR